VTSAPAGVDLAGAKGELLGAAQIAAAAAPYARGSEAEAEDEDRGEVAGTGGGAGWRPEAASEPYSEDSFEDDLGSDLSD